jgi:YidC/Oxa1 family membrane protein insertase
MEKRVLLAIVLSFLILILYQAFFIKRQPEPETPAESITEIEKKPEEKPAEKELLSSPAMPEEIEPAEEERDLQPISAQAEEEVLIDTSLYQALWSNKGAVLKSWRLKKHTDENKENLELVSLRAAELDIYPFAIRTDDPRFNSTINTALFEFSNLKLELEDGRSGELRFQYADDKGTRVEKILAFQDGKYDFEVTINVWKYGQEIEFHTIWGPGIGNPTPAEQKSRFGGARGMAVFPPPARPKKDRLEERRFTKTKQWQDLIAKKQNDFYSVRWAAYEDNYFTALFLTYLERSSASFNREGSEENPYFFLSVSSPQRVYIGPKDFDTLSNFGYEAKKLIRFGFFGIISEILLKASKSIHKIIPNWGVSIIILTFIIKILFFPLTYSSMRSMSKMQELQPKIKALRAKYKKAKQDIAQRRKMNEEIMKLYKEHGINPAGGCLPLLIQIPVFWGFFRLLVVAIEFRHSPFIFWIKDLSVKDPFYITPILMGVTQFISQKMTPTSADPTQARMMLLMPVIMTIFFMNFQSGLVLYWLTNNVLQIGQQYIMNRMRQKKKSESHGKRRKK